MDPRRARSGFTLVELLIVVVILGILAGIVLPQFQSTAEEARQTVFVHDLRVFVEQAILCMERTGTVVPDSSSGQEPGGEYSTYIDLDTWTDPTPLGGVWDSEWNSFGVWSAVGVHFQSDPVPDASVLAAVDDVIDDGDVTTGAFRQLASDRVYFVIQEVQTVYGPPP